MTWKSKVLSDESIKSPATSNNSPNPKIDYFNKLKFQVKFSGSCLKKHWAFTSNKIINLYTIITTLY